MTLIYQNRFHKDKSKLDKTIHPLIEKALELFSANPSHNSLNFEHIQCKRNKHMYSIRASKAIRILLTKLDEERYEVMRVIEHKSYERLIGDC